MWNDCFRPKPSVCRKCPFIHIRCRNRNRSRNSVDLYYQCMKMFTFKDLNSTMSFYGHCSFTYLWNMHLIQIHDDIRNAAVVIKRATECRALSTALFCISPAPVRPIVPICPSICHTRGSIKNGWWILCNFHRTVNLYLQFLRHKFHLVILEDSPERGRQTMVGMETSYFL